MRFTRIKTGLLDSNMNGLTWQTLLTTHDGDEYKKSDLLNQPVIDLQSVDQCISVPGSWLDGDYLLVFNMEHRSGKSGTA